MDTTPEERAEDRRKRIVEHVVRPEEDPEAFDKAFWASMSGEERVDVFWGMVQDWLSMQGCGGEEPRLQRSAERVLRR